MLAKSPQQRLTLQGVAEHPWLTRGGRESLRLEHTREAASEAEVSEALVEVVQLELDLAGDPPAHTSHAREDGGLSAWLRRYRSEAWGQPAAAAGSAGGAVANKQVRLVVTSSRGSDSKDGIPVCCTQQVNSKARVTHSTLLLRLHTLNLFLLLFVLLRKWQRY